MSEDNKVIRLYPVSPVGEAAIVRFSEALERKEDVYWNGESLIPLSYRLTKCRTGVEFICQHNKLNL